MSEGVSIPRALADEMVAHCIAERPNEACGILATHGGLVVKVFRMTNASASPVRYSLVPKEQLAVYRKLDEEEWDLGAVFHSHTRTEAYPSPTDVKLASENVPYLIVSLAVEPPSIRAFRIVKDSWQSDEGDIQEVPVEISG
jgi:proteasome lid subunit RPN8/RPN11